MDEAKHHLNLFVHQHKPRQSKGRGNQNLRANSAKYWTLNVPIQHPHKKATGQKTCEKHIAAQKKTAHQEKHKNRSGTRRVPEKNARKRARRARKTRAENSPRRRRRPAGPPSSPAATPPPLPGVSSSTKQ